MAKLTKPFEGVQEGEIYPTQFAKGDECPDELVAAAIAFGALSDKDKAALEKAAAEAEEKLAAEAEAAAKTAADTAKNQETEQ